MVMRVFADSEIAYLRGQRLGRLATANGSGLPHVVPTSFNVDAVEGVIEIGGHDIGGPRRYRANIAVNPQAAFVVDDLASVDPWRPRGIEVIGRAEIKSTGGERLGPGFGATWVRITPTRIRTWGIDTKPGDPPSSRSVG
jgi:pyridoxamine 5'-phosphate oxidase family protein